ncbi:hypothetical protein EDD21DRAFT_229674 [Dissophora ornata]|nr:hypothetical protein EDD21DRAFT_229674 [Dissophora ornata]
MDNQTPFTPIPQEQTFAHNHCLSDPQTSTYAHPTPPLNLYTTLDFPQQAQEPASNLAFLLPWQPPQPQPSDIPHNPAPMLGNISSSMGTPSLNSQYYCNPSYNTDLPIQPSVSLCQPLPLRSHGPCQQPLLAVESVSDIMLNNVPSTNSGIYDFDSQLRGTPLMPNTTIPLQNPTLNNYLCPPEPIGGESLLQPQQQQQRMDVDDDLAQDTSHFLVHQTQPSQLHSQQHHSFYLSNSLVIDSDQAAEVQRVTDILYTPPASPFLNSLNSGDTISQEQMAPETQELSFADRKRRGSDNHRQRGHKRQKKAIQLQKKLEIIEYWEQNQNASYQKIGEHFCIPRTTIHGIVKNREILRDHAKSKPRAGLTMETSRMVEPRFRILEEVLMTWITDLRSRCAPISGWKITGQAFNIHRMLSELPAEPLPPCQFTSGWLKNFKKRRHISLEAMHRNMIASDDFERAFKEVRGHIAGYAINRIYTCGVTSMYLTAIPMVVFQDEKKKKKKVFQDEGQNCQTNNVDSASASVLFCSNADGSDKRKPLVLGTQEVYLI